MQKVTFIRQEAFRPQQVKVREDRTMDETKKQLSRLIGYEPNGHRMNQIRDVYHRTFWALHATGRGGYTMDPMVKLLKVEE